MMTAAEREAFMAKRRTMIGGSDAAAVYSFGYGCQRRLVMQKRGVTPDYEPEETLAMERGREMEDIIARKYAAETGRRVEQVGTRRHPQYPFLGVHMDRVVWRDDRPDPGYLEIKCLAREMFHRTRKEGLIGLESHIEDPEKSAIFSKYPSFTQNHHAVSFLTDTLKVLLTGAVEEHHLSEILDLDLERQHEEALAVPAALHRVGDAMPGFGIVAAVLGVVITMGSISGAASEIGEKVAAALVGTFLGILLAYGVIGPVASAVEGRLKSEESYMMCIRTALLAFARGDSPMTAVEFARRNIEPADRPSFAELEGLTRRRAA